MDTPSRVATLAWYSGLGAVALLVLGPLLAQMGLPPLVGFYTFALGLLDGLIAILLGVVALFLTRPASGRGGRGLAVRGLVLGVLCVGVVLLAASAGSGLPAINDITTNTEDPPKFDAVAKLGPNQGRDMNYPGAGFAQLQRAAYTDLAPIQVPEPPAQALVAAKRAAESLGWEIVGEDGAAGRLEATQTSKMFRFVDDVVVRVRPAGAGSVVDVRSKSRDGRGDLGANAARIRAFRDALGAAG